MKEIISAIKLIISSLFVLAITTGCRANLGNIFDLY